MSERELSTSQNLVARSVIHIHAKKTGEPGFLCDASLHLYVALRGDAIGQRVVVIGRMFAKREPSTAGFERVRDGGFLAGGKILP